MYIQDCDYNISFSQLFLLQLVEILGLLEIQFFALLAQGATIQWAYIPTEPGC